MPLPAGEFAYRLKVKAGSASLADFLQRRILGIKGVTRIQAQSRRPQKNPFR
jgi:hypothetical protein